MRVRVVGENLLERLALRLNLAPQPVAETLWGPASGAVLIAAVRSGVIAALAGEPLTAGELIARLDLAPHPARLLLACLESQGHITTCRGERYQLAPRARKWLDPRSSTYVGGFIASNQDYWPWWSGLTDAVQYGQHFEMHGLPRGAIRIGTHTSLGSTSWRACPRRRWPRLLSFLADREDCLIWREHTAGLALHCAAAIPACRRR